MMKIKILVQGNMTKDQTLSVANILKTNFACEPLDAAYELKGRCYQMPLGTNVFRVKSLMLNDDNSHIKNYYQIGPNNFRNRNLTQLAVKILKPKAFDYLRNKEQLGYSVGCKHDNTKEFLGLIVHVSSQEHKHSYTEILEKMETFTNEIARTAIKDLTDEEFENFKQSRIKMLSADHNTIAEELEANWNEIKERYYIFDRTELTVKVLKSLTKADLQEFFESFTRPENMRKLSVQVIGNQQIEGAVVENSLDRELKVKFITEKLTEDENLIGEDIGKFQKDLLLHPVYKFEI